MITQEIHYITLPLDEIRQSYIKANGSDKKITAEYCVPDDGDLPIIWIGEIDG